MNLKSFGCSFIFGSELSDEISNELYAEGSNLTWPALLAKELNYSYRSYSRPGCGNLQIADRVLTHAANNKSCFFVIGWTWIDRFDYENESAGGWIPSDHRRWKTIVPTDNNDIAKIYYKELHSEYCDKLNSLMAIKLVIDTLKQKNIPFIMTYMDELLFKTDFNSSGATMDLQDYVRPYMTTFEGLNFLDWSKKHNYPIGPGGHPLDEAHAAAAKYILELGVHKK